jgi:SHS2 domain-containing protein
MVYKLMEHKADMGIYAQGARWSEAFSEGARALYDVMTDVKNISLDEKINIVCEADTLENLFIKWLNELIFITDTQTLFFGDFEVTIKKHNDNFKLNGYAIGEKINKEKHEFKVEVKAATYYGLKCEKKDNNVYCQCVLDI